MNVLRRGRRKRPCLSWNSRRHRAREGHGHRIPWTLAATVNSIADPLMIPARSASPEHGRRVVARQFFPFLLEVTWACRCRPRSCTSNAQVPVTSTFAGACDCAKTVPQDTPTRPPSRRPPRGVLLAHLVTSMVRESCSTTAREARGSRARGSFTSTGQHCFWISSGNCSTSRRCAAAGLSPRRGWLRQVVVLADIQAHVVELGGLQRLIIWFAAPAWYRCTFIEHVDLPPADRAVCRYSLSKNRYRFSGTMTRCRQESRRGPAVRAGRRRLSPRQRPSASKDVDRRQRFVGHPPRLTCPASARCPARGRPS